MPKIPIFQTQARPTAEVGSVKSNIQIPLTQNIGSALEPLTKAIVDYKIKEKNTENKTEALELENRSVIELNDVAQKASSLYKNSSEANAYVMQESKLIRDKYAAQASNGTVKTLFNNNYLLEEQKKIFSVDNKVYQNLIQSRAVASKNKEERILTEGIYGDNELAKQQLPTDLKKIYTDDYSDGVISIAEYEKKMASIPNTITYFEVQKDITRDPVQAYVSLNTGKYEGLTIKTREELKRDAKLEAAPILRENIINHLTGLENKIEVPINEPAIKEIFGSKVYQDFKETQTNTIRVSTSKLEIANSKIGDENKILENFKLNSGNLAEDLKYKQKLRDFASKKEELIKKDPATLILTYNPTVRKYYDAYSVETNSDIKSQLFKKYTNSVVEAQTDMGINDFLIKVLPNQLAEKIVIDYESKKPEQKIGYLTSMEKQYGENYGRVLNQLTGKGLPVTAKLISYFGDLNFAKMATSIDSKEEKVRLNNYLATTNVTYSTVNKEVGDKLNDFRKVVMFSNTMNTTKANKELNDIQETMTYMAINAMSAGKSEGDAVTTATDYIKNNFRFGGGKSIFGGDNTYFVPKKYNNETLSEKHIEFIQRKADVIKEEHLIDFDMQKFKSTNPNISDKDLNESMLEQAKENGVWINTPDGAGIQFAIQFKDGSLGIITNKQNKPLQINFDDDSYLLPGTNKIINMKKAAPTITATGS
jgi:hypothetical protein